MTAEQDIQGSYGGGISTLADEKSPKRAETHQRPRPSVNVGLAQDYKERQDLPIIDQGATTRSEQSTEDISDSDGEYVKIVLDERLVAQQQQQQQRGIRTPFSLLSRRQTGSASTMTRDDSVMSVPPRDIVTGRLLSEHGRSCLRCFEKGLRCTLTFIGKESEPQCAACRRSNTPYCVRVRSFVDTGDMNDESGESEDSFFHLNSGRPWENPNFFAGTAPGGKPLQRAEMQAMLKDFYQGESRLVMGNYVTESDTWNYVLPPLSAALPEMRRREEDGEERGNCDGGKERVVHVVRDREVSWKDVLPMRQNLSLRPRSRWADAKAVAEGKQEEESRKVIGSGDDTGLFRNLRKYSPREQNLEDVLGETW